MDCGTCTQSLPGDNRPILQSGRLLRGREGRRIGTTDCYRLWPIHRQMAEKHNFNKFFTINFYFLYEKLPDIVGSGKIYPSTEVPNGFRMINKKK